MTILEGFVQRGRKPAHTLVDPLRRRGRERQPQRVGAGAVHEERTADDEQHTVLHGAGEQGVAVKAWRPGYPDEKPPRGSGQVSTSPMCWRSARSMTVRFCWYRARNRGPCAASTPRSIACHTTR